MKYKVAATFIFLFWLAALILGVWCFKLLLQASTVPEFATGLVGGAVYALVMRAVVDAVSGSFKDCVSEWRAQPSNDLEE